MRTIDPTNMNQRDHDGYRPDFGRAVAGLSLRAVNPLALEKPRLQGVVRPPGDDST